MQPTALLDHGRFIGGKKRVVESLEIRETELSAGTPRQVDDRELCNRMNNHDRSRIPAVSGRR